MSAIRDKAISLSNLWLCYVVVVVVVSSFILRGKLGNKEDWNVPLLDFFLSNVTWVLSASL